MLKERVATFIQQPKKSLFKLAAPVVAGMVAHTLYNIIDTAFVGRLGAEAIAALTFSFPIFFIFIAISSGLAAGVGSRISRYLGSDNPKAAENTAMHGLFLSLILSVLLVVFGTMGLKPLFSLFGASDEVLMLAVSYTTIILAGTLFILPANILSTILSSQGDTKTPMKIQITTLILNIILDPILIFGFDLGVQGAAIATFCSFVLSLILFLYFTKANSHLSITLRSYRFSPYILKSIITVGTPASLVMLMMSVYIMAINGFMSHFSMDHVAAFGMAMRLESVATLPIVGLSMALLTLVGMFEGAKRFDLIELISWFSIRISILITSIIGVFFFVFPEFLFQIFTSDPKLLMLSSDYMRINVFTFPLIAISISAGRILQGMGYGAPGFFFNFIRVFLVALPLAYLFVYILNLSYLFVPIAMVIGGIVGGFVAIIWLQLKLKKKL